MFTLEKEVETLKRWFEDQYPEYKLTIHVGRGKMNCEEYTIELKAEQIHKGITFRIPDHAQFQEESYIKKLRESFVTQNKRAIKEVIAKARNVS